MKDFLTYMIGGFQFTATGPEVGFFRLVLICSLNSALRFGALFGVIYVAGRALQILS